MCLQPMDVSGPWWSWGCGADPTPQTKFWRGAQFGANLLPMPAHPKTTDAQVVQAARHLVEREGRDGFSMNDVAASVGIRAPSLYGRFNDRAGLLGAVELQVCAELAGLLGKAVIANDPEGTLMAQAKAVRRFATRNPNSYSLLFDVRSVPTEEGATARAAALLPLMPPLAALVGEKNALAAARVLTPFLHGFISMDLANAFRLGGGLDAAFKRGVSTILRGLAQWSED
jgi:AcrR family transcriptional regulator